jgi:hypothetical protein
MDCWNVNSRIVRVAAYALEHLKNGPSDQRSKARSTYLEYESQKTLTECWGQSDDTCEEPSSQTVADKPLSRSLREN